MITSPHNLPSQLTPLIGREKELEELVRLLEDSGGRFITLAGMGGVGKTRLAVETGRAMLNHFPDGVWFVNIAAITSLEHFVGAVAGAIGFKCATGQDPKSQLFHYLHNKNLLLILDNLEHLLPAVTAEIEDLLLHAPSCHVLATSRQPLDVPWEWVFVLHGLAVEPSADTGGDRTAPAVRLFLQQLKRNGAPAKELDPGCAAEISLLVSGLPLALLLAASWGRVLGCRAIQQEIQQGIEILRARHQGFPERHSSMRAVFDYSWSLLSAREQAVLQKLAVFQGGFHREAAAKVADADLPTLAALVDRSLVERISHDRYQIHELLRQYVNSRPFEAPKAEQTRDAHLAYYVGLGQEAEPGLIGRQQHEWIQRLRLEIDNLRTALSWSLSAEVPDRAVQGLKLSTSVGRFFLYFNHIQEGYRWLVLLLRAVEAGRREPAFERTYAQGLVQAAHLSFLLEDFEASRHFAKTGLAIAHSLNDPQLLGDAYYCMGIEAFQHDDNQAARSALEMALMHYRQCDYGLGMLQAHNALGRLRLYNGEFPSAYEHMTTALKLAREQGYVHGIYTSLRRLGELATADPSMGVDQAEAYYEEALQYARKVDDKDSITTILYGLGEIARARGQYGRALELFQESDKLNQEIGWLGLRVWPLLNQAFMHLHVGNVRQSAQIFRQCLQMAETMDHLRAERVGSLFGLATVALAQGQARLAAQIIGGLEPHFDLILIFPTDKAEYERAVNAAKAQLGEKGFSQALQEGRGKSLDEVAQLAAQVMASQKEDAKGGSDNRMNNLTTRELEVLRLVAQGLSDQLVAERLVISPRTVNAHLTSIYNKLGVNSRVEATRYALEKGLT